MGRSEKFELAGESSNRQIPTETTGSAIHSRVEVGTPHLEYISLSTLISNTKTTSHR